MDIDKQVEENVSNIADIGGFSESLAPISQKFGTGNLEVDLLICCLIVAFSFLCIFVWIYTRKPSRATYDLDDNARVSNDDLRYRIGTLERQIQAMIEDQRGDAGYVKQELADIREMLSGLAEDFYLDTTASKKSSSLRRAI